MAETLESPMAKSGYSKTRLVSLTTGARITLLVEDAIITCAVLSIKERIQQPNWAPATTEVASTPTPATNPTPPALAAPAAPPAPATLPTKPPTVATARTARCFEHSLRTEPAIGCGSACEPCAPCAPGACDVNECCAQVANEQAACCECEPGCECEPDWASEPTPTCEPAQQLTLGTIECAVVSHALRR